MEDKPQRAAWADLVRQPAPREAAGDREGDREEHDELRSSFALRLLQTGSHRDVDGVEDHDVDDGVDGVGIKHSTDKKPKQTREFLAVSQRCIRAAQRIEHRSEIDCSRIWISSFLDEQQAWD